MNLFIYVRKVGVYDLGQGGVCLREFGGTIWNTLKGVK